MHGHGVSCPCTWISSLTTPGVHMTAVVCTLQHKDGTLPSTVEVLEEKGHVASALLMNGYPQEVHPFI